MSQAVMHEHIPVTAAGFRERGFGRFDNLIDEDELAYLRDVYDQLFADPASQPGFKNLGGEDAAGNYLMPQIGGASNIHPELHELKYFKRLRDLAKDLLGDEAAFRNDHMIFKPAGTPRDTPWHQDQAYHSPNLRYKNVNFWLPLDGASVEEGCLWFVPYTHGGTVHPHTNNFAAGGATAVSAENQDYWMRNGVAVPCPVGSVSAHHSYCMHYAGPNKTNKPRRAWINVFVCPPEELAQPLDMPWMDERF